MGCIVHALLKEKKKMTKKKKWKKIKPWIKAIELNQPCGCQVKLEKIGAKIIFCKKHSPPERKWTPEGRLAYLIENLKVDEENIVWQLKHGINDSCFHCENENAMSKHEILKQFTRILLKKGMKDGRIESVKKRDCPFCKKTNFLYCAITNPKDRKSGWDYYPFPTEEHVKAYMIEMRKGNIENAEMYKPKAKRTTRKSYMV